MISLTNYDFQWARSELVIIYPDEYSPMVQSWIYSLEQSWRIMVNTRTFFVRLQRQNGYVVFGIFMCQSSNYLSTPKCLTFLPRWCPSSLAKLVQITPISLWFMADITIVFMGFINQIITGGHHPVGKNDKQPVFKISNFWSSTSQESRCYLFHDARFVLPRLTIQSHDPPNACRV